MDKIDLPAQAIVHAETIGWRDIDTDAMRPGKVLVRGERLCTSETFPELRACDEPGIASYEPVGWEGAHWRGECAESYDEYYWWKPTHWMPLPSTDTPDPTRALLLALADALEQEKATKDGAYLERNQCVSLIARMAIALGYDACRSRTAIEGWSDDWHGCVYIQLPAGQVSWHYHDSQAYLFGFLPEKPCAWDGHDTPEKYRRIMSELPSFALADRVKVLEEALTAAERSLTASIELIEKHVPSDALGIDSAGDMAEAHLTWSWPVLDEFLHYVKLDRDLARRALGADASQQGEM